MKMILHSQNGVLKQEDSINEPQITHQEKWNLFGNWDYIREQIDAQIDPREELHLGSGTQLPLLLKRPADTLPLKHRCCSSGLWVLVCWLPLILRVTSPVQARDSCCQGMREKWASTIHTYTNAHTQHNLGQSRLPLESHVKLQSTGRMASSMASAHWHT